jgi:tetratricopeptide (TPR) repeat protein/DNA-binding CsgD family transcriptional regulator
MGTSIEELHERLAAARKPADRIDLLIEIATLLSRTDPKAARRHARKAASLATAADDPVRVARSEVVTGYCHVFQCDYSRAMRTLEPALDSGRALGDAVAIARASAGIAAVYVNTDRLAEGVALLLDTLTSLEGKIQLKERLQLDQLRGSAYQKLGDNARALEYLLRCEVMSRDAGEEMTLLGITNNIGAVYLALGNYESAEEYLQRGIELAAAHGNSEVRMACLQNLARIHHSLGRLERAMECSSEALELSRQLSNPAAEAFALNNLGIFHSAVSQPERGLEYYRKAFEVAEQIGDGTRWYYLSNIGENHLAMGNYDAALDCMQQAMEGGKGNPKFEFQLHQMLSNYYEATGDPARALEHHREYVRLREEVSGQQQQRAMMQLQMRAEIERGAREREIMRLEKLRLEQEMEHKQNELTAMALHLVEKNQFLDTLKREMGEVLASVEGKARPAVRNLMRQVDGNMDSDDDWGAFERQFEQVHHGFIERLSQRYPKLTRTELKVCALLKIRMSSKEIANILATSIMNIEIHRYHIRKKLGLDGVQSLTAAMSQIAE